MDEADDPVQQIESEFHDVLDRIVDRMREFDAVRLIEVSRLAFLPWSNAQQHAVSAEAGAAHVELLALIALAARVSGKSGGGQVMSHFVSEVRSDLDNLLTLSQLRAMAENSTPDKLAMISTLVRGSEVWVRNTSYPDRIETTLLELFDGYPEVRQALVAGLGFCAADAFAVLEGCHKVQQDKMNLRMQDMFGSINAARATVTGDSLDPAVREATLAKWDAAWEPEAGAVTVGVDEIVAATGQPEDRVRSVVDRFRLDLGSATPMEVVSDFVAGRNPLRTRPLVIAEDGRVLLPHNALTAGAIRENLEQYLKSSTAWEVYANHRGHLLETRTHVALETVLPGATHRDGVEYYVPANQRELEAGDPAKYTKRVEGDHLILIDDVALIVEDKAVAFSELSRGGEVKRIRKDLTGIITKAAEQAGRLREVIERDGGVRIEGEGWVDLGHIREIHTIAVSLDDLSSVTTATARLVEAGLLAPENICWTVSLHDLELIAELVDRPAEFLLYLRRRRNPDVTVLYTAQDELDLFLYFFETGLWVEPNPDRVRAAFPFLGQPTTAERRRYRRQIPGLITSRTDPLDRWYYARKQTPQQPVPKPSMTEPPLAALIDSVREQGTYGWLSIGATLLGASYTSQAKIASAAKALLSAPRNDGRGRSITWPLTGSTDRAEGWLLALVTCPPGQDRATFEKDSIDYLRVKKHQLKLPRGMLFLYDEQTHELLGVHYDGTIGLLPEYLIPKLDALMPPEALQGSIPNLRKSRSKKRKKTKK